MDDDVVEIVGVKPPCFGSTRNKTRSKRSAPLDDFNFCLGLVSDPEQILSSPNPGLELALRGHFTGPVVVQNSLEKDLIVAENCARSHIKSEAVEWYFENGLDELIQKDKYARYEPLRKLNFLMEGVSPGQAHVNFEKMLPPVIEGGSDVPMQIIKVEESGKSNLLEVVHHDKIKELSKLVKFSKDPWSSSLQQQLMQVQVEMESAEYEADEGVQGAVIDLAVIAQKEGLMSKMGASFHGRNVRLAWCNVMNSFLRKDPFMFTMCLQVLMYHLESGN
jgi:hypothetical protein